jgi:colanic acid/amylovoran biosynthesis protein
MNALAGSRFREHARRFWHRSGLKHRYQNGQLALLGAEWKALRMGAAQKPEPAGRETGQARVLIIPPDPVLLTASLGDEAMIKSVLLQCRDLLRQPSFAIAVAGSQARAIAEQLGLGAIDALANARSLRTSLHKLLAFRPTHVVLVGADVLDGAYDPVFSARLIALADLLCSCGALGSTTGFSVSHGAHASMRYLRNFVGPELSFAARDPISYQRFRRITGRSVDLTADIAFLLPSTELGRGLAATSTWIAEQRQEGRCVLAFNIHPLLLDANQRGVAQKLIQACADGAAAAIRDGNVSILLLEHDLRGSAGDRMLLEPLRQELVRQVPSNRVHLPDGGANSQEIKAITKLLDGVVTGRMHLAIAALGVGTPVLGIGYKDKMEGLLQHFELGREFLTSAQRLMSDQKHAAAAIAQFVQALPEARQKIHERLPVVQNLARGNLKSFAGEKRAEQAQGLSYAAKA